MHLDLDPAQREVGGKVGSGPRFFLTIGYIDETQLELEIIFFIEEQLGVKVKDEEMIPDNLDSVSKIAAFVSNKRKAA